MNNMERGVRDEIGWEEPVLNKNKLKTSYEVGRWLRK